MFKTHAQERAMQRYNKELTDTDLESIKKAIRNNQHTFLYNAKDDDTKKFCYLKYKHIPYKILYKISKKKCRIITIYPLDIDEYNNIEDEKKQKKIQSAINLLEQNGYKVTRE